MRASAVFGPPSRLQCRVSPARSTAVGEHLLEGEPGLLPPAGAGQRPWPPARPTSRTAMNWANPWIG